VWYKVAKTDPFKQNIGSSIINRLFAAQDKTAEAFERRILRGLACPILINLGRKIYIDPAWSSSLLVIHH